MADASVSVTLAWSIANSVRFPGHETVMQRLFASFLQVAQDYGLKRDHSPLSEWLVFSLFQRILLSSDRPKILFS
jgi:hypothetical protein